jgi:Domain of unknown function (DUF1840)
MALVVFRSKAAGEIFMFAETARRLKAAAEQAERADKQGEESSQPRAITLGQRAFPLIEMLRAARKKNVDVTWGI